MARSSPPVERSHESPFVNVTLVMCDEWPSYDRCAAWGTMHGYRKSFTLPQSSAVASSPSLPLAPHDRATALMSVPSDCDGQMPRTGQPKRTECVAHSVSLILEADFSCRGRHVLSAFRSRQYSSSYAPQHDCRQHESTDQSSRRTNDECPFSRTLYSTASPERAIW
eukprot:scaffold1854_cov113-Isochrysis_galbana.AAC.5